ncbi:hypothetical protein AAVH_03422 [Aphelenchoides avenae]|nr:hypothetical protein AAVH_03422 [Aphelenchus avenae]
MPEASPRHRQGHGPEKQHLRSGRDASGKPVRRGRPFLSFSDGSREPTSTIQTLSGMCLGSSVVEK